MKRSFLKLAFLAVLALAILPIGAEAFFGLPSIDFLNKKFSKTEVDVAGVKNEIGTANTKLTGLEASIGKIETRLDVALNAKVVAVDNSKPQTAGGDIVSQVWNDPQIFKMLFGFLSSACAGLFLMLRQQNAQHSKESQAKDAQIADLQAKLLKFINEQEQAQQQYVENLQKAQAKYMEILEKLAMSKIAQLQGA